MRLFSTDERDKILIQLQNDIRQMNDVESFILVGSGSYGFRDSYSDIDCIIVISDKIKTELIIENIYLYFIDKFNLLSINKILSTERKLLICLTNSFLEIDLSVVNEKDIVAQKENWKVIFDNTGRIEKVLEDSWEIRKRNIKNYTPIESDTLNVWNYILHGFIAIQRKELFRGYKEIQILFEELVKYYANKNGLQYKRFRDIDKLPKALCKRLESCLPRGITEERLLEALKNNVTEYKCITREDPILSKEIHLYKTIFELEKMIDTKYR